MRGTGSIIPHVMLLLVLAVSFIGTKGIDALSQVGQQNQIDVQQAIQGALSSVSHTKISERADELLRIPVVEGLDSEPEPLWRRRNATVAERVKHLLSILTLDEMISSLDAQTQPTGGIPRLGIPSFTGWSECLHGGVDLGETRYGTTSFPQALGLASAFDRKMLHEIATIISDEMRAVANLYHQADGTARALNCFSPNINLVRDPRWGRASETYGEDPYLTAELAVAYVTGLQGNDSTYVKVGATCKHYAAYSLEVADAYTRHSFDAQVSDRDLLASYTPQFKACVKAGAKSVMCSYNAVNGKPSCASPELLQDLLREKWNFTGFVVSDCGAINDILFPHRFVNSNSEGNAAALKAGTDMNCVDYSTLRQSYIEGLITEDDLKKAAGRVFEHKIRLGVLDPPSDNPYTRVPASIIGAPAHKLKAIEAAKKGTVLLKNRDIGNGKQRLPLNPLLTRKIVVAGPHARSTEHLLGNYYGAIAGPVTSPLQALQNVLGSERVQFAGDDFFLTEIGADGKIDGAAGAAQDADAVIVFLGTSTINPHFAWEDGYVMQAITTENEGYDRNTLKLPGVQEVLVGELARMTDTPIIVVLINGGPLDVQVFEENDRVDAILTGWFPGQGAQAIADIIFGITSPSGRLPTTFYYENYTSQILASDMDMRAWPGRTHRFLQVPVLYPFGHGLSYNHYSYSNLLLRSHDLNAEEPSVHVSVQVTNNGLWKSDLAVLAFVHCQPRKQSSWRVWQRSEQGLGHKALGDFQNIHLLPGESQSVDLKISGDNLDNLLADELQPSHMLGDLHVTVEDTQIALPTNRQCLLSMSGSRAQKGAFASYS